MKIGEVEVELKEDVSQVLKQGSGEEGKYVLLRTSVPPVITLVARPRAQYHYHRVIVEEHISKGGSGYPLGGGSIQIDPGKMLISVFDYSGSYGHAPMDIVLALLQLHFPGYEIKSW